MRRGRGRHGDRRPDRHGDAVAAPVRHRGAEAALPRARDPRRDGHGDRGHRARRGFGRRGAAHPGDPRRRRLGDRRRQALHHQRRAGRLALPAGPHLRGGRRTRDEPDRRPHRDSRGQRLAQARQARQAVARTPRSSPSPGSASRCRTPSARSAAASSSRWRSSRTSGWSRATAGSPPASGPSTAPGTTWAGAPPSARPLVGQPVPELPARRALRPGRPVPPLQLRVRRGLRPRARTPSRFATIAKLAVGRLLRGRGPDLPAVPRRHRLHGGDLDRRGSSATCGSRPSAAAPTR